MNTGDERCAGRVSFGRCGRVGCPEDPGEVGDACIRSGGKDKDVIGVGGSSGVNDGTQGAVDGGGAGSGVDSDAGVGDGGEPHRGHIVLSGNDLRQENPVVGVGVFGS